MHSVKWKLTLLYTFFMTLLVCLVIGILLSLGTSELLSVEEVNGEFHLYTVDGTDWYFYVNEKLSDADVDEITINPDDAYAFRVCQRPEPELRVES